MIKKIGKIVNTILAMIRIVKIVMIVKTVLYDYFIEMRV